MKITKKQIETLRPFIPDLDKLIADDDLDELETQLFYAMSDNNISEDDYELNETGEMLYHLYYEIYRQNKPKRSLLSRLFKRKAKSDG